MMIKAILIDTVHGIAEEVEMDGEPDTINKLLNCRFTDYVRRYIGKKQYMVIVDDESLLKENAVPSAVLQDGTIHLAGNLLICNYTADGDLKSLTEEDITGIMQNLVYMRNKPAVRIRG